MSELTAAEIQTLQEALDDEYKAWATYDQVLTDFGEVRPFTNIREAEARHIEAVCGLFRRYGLAIPDNPWPGKVPRYATLQEACEAGVAAEIANGEMYERLLGTTGKPQILRVLRNLQKASQNRHLAAFRRCADKGPSPRAGRGRRWG